MAIHNSDSHRVVIIGGGFGGLYAAKILGGKPVAVTLIDRRNFHLFQPLLYQVATGGLSPGDIASPLRAVLNRYKNIQVLLAEVVDIDIPSRTVVLSDGSLQYDSLIIATGGGNFYFGHERWQRFAPGLKTIEDALEMRRRILLAFEAAEREPDPEIRQAWMTLVVVGGGPTGVELAGALAELAHQTFRRDFRNINPAHARILLMEGGERILPAYPPELSQKAKRALQKLGVTIETQTLVTNILKTGINIRSESGTRFIPARTILWAAGIQASPMGKLLARKTGAQLDKMGRVVVNPDLTLPGHSEIFVVGDLAHLDDAREGTLPGIAPVAMQEGRYAAAAILRRLRNKKNPPFRYRDKGMLAVIGRNAAVANFRKIRLSGYPAWITWVLVHIRYLIEFDNKVLVLMQWAWDYLTRKKGARLITGPSPFPLVRSGTHGKGKS